MKSKILLFVLIGAVLVSCTPIHQATKNNKGQKVMNDLPEICAKGIVYYYIFPNAYGVGFAPKINKETKTYEECDS